MKYPKYIIRGIILAPFILGIPIGHEILSHSPQELKLLPPMSIFEGIVAIPGIISCCIILLALICLTVYLLFAFLHWVFSGEKEL